MNETRGLLKDTRKSSLAVFPSEEKRRRQQSAMQKKALNRT
jgi:hypothetical protein